MVLGVVGLNRRAVGPQALGSRISDPNHNFQHQDGEENGSDPALHRLGRLPVMIRCGNLFGAENRQDGEQRTRGAARHDGKELFPQPPGAEKPVI